MTYETLERMVNEHLAAYVDSLGEIPATLRESMLYSLEAGGKRLRPVLLLAAYGLLHEDVTPALPYACALEMIHTYSLIHDDLPAMDNDTLRRGKPTNHVRFGEAVAILAGDGLLNAAFELMLREAASAGSLAGLRAAEIIARRAGVTGMIAGQTLDVTLEGTAPSLEKVSYIHAHKTADLLTAPLEAGLTLAGASDAALAAGREYGFHLGIAFQMVDDLLDLEKHRHGRGTGKTDVACLRGCGAYTAGCRGSHTQGYGGAACVRRSREFSQSPCAKYPDKGTIRRRIRMVEEGRDCTTCQSYCKMKC